MLHVDREDQCLAVAVAVLEIVLDDGRVSTFEMCDAVEPRLAELAELFQMPEVVKRQPLFNVGVGRDVNRPRAREDPALDEVAHLDLVDDSTAE